MKIFKAAACVFILIALLLTGCADSRPNDFRNADFGMSISEVSKSEHDDYLFAADDLLFYETSMNGEKAEVCYYFVDDALCEAECKFIIDGTTIDSNIERYLAMSEYLTSLYGEPLNPDYRVWTVDSSEFENDKESMSIYYGNIIYVLEWKTETANISLALDYKDEQINFLYKAKAVVPEE